jgi:hypothetical protein
MRKIDNDTAKIWQFSDVHELADFAERSTPPGSHGDEEGREDWFGGSWITALEKARDGDLTLAGATSPLMERFERLALQTQGSAWVNDVAGSCANVPAFVAGQPLSMRRRVKVEKEMAPIVVFVDLFVSCGFKPEQIKKRGIAALALARILSMKRPVELWVGASTVSDKRDRYMAPLVRIDTAPMDLSHAAFAIISPLFTRRIQFAIMRAMGPSLQNLSPSTNARTAPTAAMATAFPDAEMLIVPPLVGSPKTGDALAWTDPEQWILQQIERAAPEMLEAA